MITQRKQMYACHVDFNSLMVFMHLFLIQIILMASLQPKLNGSQCLTHAIMWLQAECHI